MLALHCSLAHAGAWAGLAEALHGVTVTAIDQIGHGRAADWDESSDLHAQATAAAAGRRTSLGAPPRTGLRAVPAAGAGRVGGRATRLGGVGGRVVGVQRVGQRAVGRAGSRLGE